MVWVVSFTPRPLNPCFKFPCTRLTVGCVSPKVKLDAVEKVKYLFLENEMCLIEVTKKFNQIWTSTGIFRRCVYVSFHFVRQHSENDK
jgi:hypothetical protein